MGAAKYFYHKALSIGYSPDLILSIIGKTKHHQISEQTKKAFRENIIRVRKLDTWILTGFDDSVDRLVDEAIDQDLKTNFLPVFCIKSLEKLDVDGEILNQVYMTVYFRQYIFKRNSSC